MASLNKVMLIGRLGQDPEIRYTQSGSSVANVNIATNENWVDKNGEKQERTEWHSLVLWGKLADLAQSYLKKGSQIFVEGRIQTRDWEDDQAKKHYRTEVVVTTMQFLDTKFPENNSPSENYKNPEKEQTFSDDTKSEETNLAKKEDDYIKDDIPF